MDGIAMRYSEAGLNDLRETILFLRRRQDGLTPLDVNLEGLAEAVRQLPKDIKREVEKFFLVKDSAFRRYCTLTDWYFQWLSSPPSSIRWMADKANAGALLLQEPAFAKLYDEKLSLQIFKICKGQEQEQHQLLEQYLGVFKNGQDFFFANKCEEVQAEGEILDLTSAISKWQVSPLRLKIIGEWNENFLFPEERKAIEGLFNYKVPIHQGGGGRTEPLMAKDVKVVKKQIFRRGPWETVESLVEGRCRKVPGLATLRRASSYEWRHSYDAKFYEAVGEKNLPNGETIPLYRVRGVKTSFTFSDIGEVLFLDHLYERGMI